MGKDDTMPVVRISVRELVEFILRSGNIDNRISSSMERDAMLRGGRIHRKIQRQMGAGYQAEVSLKTERIYDRFLLRVEGRADGILTREADGQTEVTVDEIKGVFRDLSQMEEPVSVHLAQAKCYAYIYAKQHQIDSIRVQMTYCHLDTEEIRRFTQQFSVEELEAWFEELTGAYEKWARFRIEWKELRNASIRKVEFPFAYREGQRDLAAAVYRTILRRKKLFIQAPTGVGKTMSTVFPAVRAIGEELGEKLFYLTARTITRTAAEQAFDILKQQGLLFKVITLTAKEKICFCEETECNPDVCPYARGHFDRVNDAVYELLTGGGTFDRQTIEEQARKHCVCPFEFSLDLALWTDAVICDYNYVFDPNAHLRRFFAETQDRGYLFLIDEAHNLVERGREMYSASLYKEEFLEVKRAVRARDGKLSRKLGEVNKLMLEMKRECETYRILESVSHFAVKLIGLLGMLEDYLEEYRDTKEREAVLDLYFHVRFFLDIHDKMDENYVIYSQMEPDGRFQVKLLCMNPSVQLSQYLDQGNSTVFFSATLLPIRYYKTLLSGDPDDYAVYAESPFPKENRQVLICTDVSSRYQSRGPRMYQKIADYLCQIVSCKKGNYLAFFPSYHFMEEVYRCFPVPVEGMDLLIQTQNMDEAEREAFLEEFHTEREKSLIGLCVMGGIFSEGIDLAKERLIGAMIIGTGIPQVSYEREIMRRYFDEKGIRGFDYAFLYPGMNKVLQSAGRVIRTEQDRGIILLMDDRFGQMQYKEMFPREWKSIAYCDQTSVRHYIERFWK